MKKFYTLAFLITFFTGSSQIVNISDANFKAKLLAASPSNSIAKNAAAQNIKIDTNNDGEIQVSEALNVYQLYVNNSSIQNMTGIEAFLNLKRLNCDNNQLTTLNVTQNLNLFSLNCSQNQLTSLDVTQNTDLIDLGCSNNQLTSLDVTQNTALTSLIFENNQLTSLNVTQNLGLKILACNFNLLTNLNVTQNTLLQTLSCGGNQLTILDVTQNPLLDYLYCNNNQLMTLDVTQNLALRILNCYENQLTSLNVTQNLNLFSLDCSQNQLTSLDVTQNVVLGRLYCSQNQLTSINVTLNTNLRELYCGINQLTTINVTQNPALTYLVVSDNLLLDLNITQNPLLSTLNCMNNQLTDLDINHQTSLISLYCSGNQLTDLNITQQTGLMFFDCSNNQLTSLDVTENTVLDYLYCNNNQLTTLDVTQNTVLSNLNCSDNELVTLYMKNNNNFFGGLNFSNNPTLQYVCASEANLSLVEQKINDYGYTNCHTNTYCSFVPNGTFYILQGNTRFDSANNYCGVNNINAAYVKFSVTNNISGLVMGSFITNENGYYSTPFQAGDYILTPQFENPIYFTSYPNVLDVSFPEETSPYTQNLCIRANGTRNDVEVTIIPVVVARPGFDAHYKIIYKNKGNQVSGGTVNFTFNDAIMDLVSVNPVSTSSATNSLTWNYTNLNPFETREIDLIFNINSPMETPAVNSDDVLQYTATIIGAPDSSSMDNIFTLNQTVVNSYDPNDKICLEGATITPEMVGQYVHYVIRFENTGTFAAQNIVVADVIDSARFNISTLIPQRSSHDFVTRINGNKVEFIFENINLPFDDANNDGYVAFKIKTKPTLVLGDTFTNSASIYFDYNFPIITDPASTTVATLNIKDFDFGNYFTVYPNPVKDVLNFEVKNEIELKSISVYNTLGQIVMAITNVDNLKDIDVSNLTAGSYFVKVHTDKGSSSSKFIKQ